MKHRAIWIILILVLFPALLTAAETARDWTSQSGKTVLEGAVWDESAGIADGKIILIKEGTHYRYPFKKLSDADQKYITDRQETDPDLVVVTPSTATPKPGERLVKTVNGVEFAFRWCPAGSFQMGYVFPREKPVHEVTLTRGFWLLETEVTQAQWQAVMGDNPSDFKGDNLPVESVSWEDCKEFCTKLSSQGLNVSLPTEAQWEYACRAGTTSAYAGNLDEMAWYSKNSGSTTHEVGQKKPNAWGLYDMHGNVWEWCSDWFDSGYYSKSPASDPTGPDTGSYRVFRGGGWDCVARNCRSALRFFNSPDFRSDGLGLRCLLVPEGK